MNLLKGKFSINDVCFIANPRIKSSKVFYTGGLGKCILCIDKDKHPLLTFLSLTHTHETIFSEYIARNWVQPNLCLPVTLGSRLFTKPSRLTGVWRGFSKLVSVVDL